MVTALHHVVFLFLFSRRSCATGRFHCAALFISPTDVLFLSGRPPYGLVKRHRRVIRFTAGQVGQDIAYGNDGVCVAPSSRQYIRRIRARINESRLQRRQRHRDARNTEVLQYRGFTSDGTFDRCCSSCRRQCHSYTSKRRRHALKMHPFAIVTFDIIMTLTFEL